MDVYLGYLQRPDKSSTVFFRTTLEDIFKIYKQQLPDLFQRDRSDRETELESFFRDVKKNLSTTHSMEIDLPFDRIWIKIEQQWVNKVTYD